MPGIALSGILIVLTVYVATVGVVLPFVASRYTPDLVPRFQLRPTQFAPIIVLLALFLASGILALAPPSHGGDVVEFLLLTAAVLVWVVATPLMWSQVSNTRALSTWLARGRQTDVLRGLLSSLLKAGDFSAARQAIVGVGIALHGRKRWTEEDGDVLSSVGSILWWSGDPRASHRRDTDQPRQLQDVQSQFVLQVQHLWRQIRTNSDPDTVRVFSLALADLVGEMPNQSLAVCLERVLEDGSQRHVLTIEILEEIACAWGLARDVPPHRDDDGQPVGPEREESREKWLDYLVIQTAALAAELGGDDALLNRMIANGYLYVRAPGHISPGHIDLIPYKWVSRASYESVSRVLKPRGIHLKLREPLPDGDVPPLNLADAG